MDDEDLAELREGRELVDKNEEMDILGGTQSEMRRKGGAEEPEKECVYRPMHLSVKLTILIQRDNQSPRSFSAAHTQ